MNRLAGHPPSSSLQQYQYANAQPPSSHLQHSPEPTRQPLPVAPPEPQRDDLSRQQPPIVLTHQNKQESLLPEQREADRASTTGSSSDDFYPTYDHKQPQYDDEVAGEQQATEPQPVLYTEEEPETAATHRRFIFVTKRPRQNVF